MKQKGKTEVAEAPKMQIKGTITIEVFEAVDESGFVIKMKSAGLNALERYGALLAACKSQGDEKQESK